TQDHAQAARSPPQTEYGRTGDATAASAAPPARERDRPRPGDRLHQARRRQLLNQERPSMTLNRAVVVLTPVFAALAGWLTEWVAQHFPGTPNLDKAQLTALFIAGATYAAGQAAHWLHGWQKQEHRDDDLQLIAS